MKTLLNYVLLLLLVLFSTVGLFFFFSPHKQVNRTQQSSLSSSPKRIVGFLPYWQMDNSPLRFNLLSEIAFFGLHTDEEGKIAAEDLTRLTTDPFKNLLKNAAQNNTQVSIVVILQDNGKIETFLKNADAWERLVNNLKPVISANLLSGLHVDFEYMGIPAKETVSAYVSFIEKVNQDLKAWNPSLTLTLEVTADAMKKSRLYDVEKLAKVCDFILLMGYDFYRPASSVAGPIAPLLGKEIYEYDVTTAVLDFLSVVPQNKLVLGVPYYGWDFPTVDETRGSSVEKRPDEEVALSTYKRNRRLIDGGTVMQNFDTDSQTPWMVYRDPDTNGIRQIWFENEISLGKKYDLVNRERLSGIAIWALGYDGDHQELWNLLAKKFR